VDILSARANENTAVPNLDLCTDGRHLAAV
jgi:hypothetical protein